MAKKDLLPLAQLMEKMTFKQFEKLMETLDRTDLELLICGAWGFIEGSGLVKVKKGGRK